MNEHEAKFKTIETKLSISAGVISLVIMFLLIGCGVFDSKNGNSEKREIAAASKIEKTEKEISQNDKAKIEQISVFAAGTDYSLNKVTNPPTEVVVAKDMNNRVISLSGTPAVDELKRIYKIVDDLTSQLEIERKRGEFELDKKDKEVLRIQKESEALVKEKDSLIKKYMDLASDTAKRADSYKENLDQMDKWFGLGAVWYGIKKFIKTMTWILLGFGIVYLLLRAFAQTNPAVAAIFSIFEMILSGFIKLIEGLAPRASEFAGNVSGKLFNGYKNTLTKIVDTLELLKEREKTLNGTKQYTISELQSELSKAMDDSDKDRINKIQSELKW